MKLQSNTLTLVLTLLLSWTMLLGNTCKALSHPSAAPADCSTCPCCDEGACPCAQSAPESALPEPKAPSTSRELTIAPLPTPQYTIAPVVIELPRLTTRRIAPPTFRGLRAQALLCSWVV